jgi:hypothetical protein
LILVFLAIIYKGGTAGAQWMTTQWWGILGLIGWAYLINALIYLFAKGNLYIMIGVLLLFNVLSVLNELDALPSLNSYLSYFSTIYSGAIPAFTSAGIVATLIFKKLSVNHGQWILFTLGLLGIIFLTYGIMTRSIWGISKIQGSPSWLAICTGIGFISFAVLYIIADIKKQTNWAKIIAPAGTATLTCYMIPYFVYPLREITGFRFSEFINTGIVGLIGSLIFALLVVVFTGWLEKKGFRLKL